MTMHPEFLERKREPDCWINVYAPKYRAGNWLGQARETRDASDYLADNASSDRVYRLKVYLKPGVQS